MARATTAYYAAHDPFADFTTAPEITQVFGELLGGWARVTWEMMGAPDDLILAEAGPGRGTLMADALRVFPHANVHFIETSARLRAAQRQRVPQAVWHDRLDDTPPGPMILFANEFLDALPIRQFVRRQAGWMERWVADGDFMEVPSDAALPDDPVGSVREIGEAAQEFVRQLARRGGVGLFIDYGPAQSAAGDSLQAIKGSGAANPLRDAGAADLTAHVDFEALCRAVRNAGAAAWGPVKQNAFLTGLGLMPRTAQLAQNAAPEAAARLRAGAYRLTAPEAMGSLFKVLAISPAGLAGLPGFAV